MLNNNERVMRLYKEYEEGYKKFLMGEEGSRRNRIRNKKRFQRDSRSDSWTNKRG